MFRKIVAALILVPLAILIVAFAVANRQAVTVSLDPFASEPSEQVMLGVTKVQDPVDALAETKVVLAGRVSVTVVFGEVAGPLLVTTCV